MRRPFVGEWTKMLVNEHFRKCVTFLYADEPDRGAVRRVPVGSVFFVGVPAFPNPAEGTGFFVYAVTARHVVDFPAMLWVRMRLTAGGFVDLPVAKDAWTHHPHTDVAVAAIQLDDSFDAAYLSVDLLATRFIAETPNLAPIGEGDDLFFSGLFVGHYGKGIPQPIIRFGNIALMPREPVTIEISKHPYTEADVDAYLVEARSWGGQSGSPAFITFSADRELGLGGAFKVGGATPFAVLGLVQGGWRYREGMKAPDPSGEGFVEVNMGISVVIPDYKILEVLMDDDLQTQRDEARKSHRPGSLALPEAASVAANESDEFGRFEDLTRQLVNTPKPKDEPSE